MSANSDDSLEKRIPKAAPQDLSQDLNQVALELFRSAVESDASLPNEWKQAALEALRDGLPGEMGGLEALIVREVLA